MKLRKLYVANAIVNFIASAVAVAFCVIAWILFQAKQPNPDATAAEQFGEGLGNAIAMIFFLIIVVPCAVCYVAENVVSSVNLLRAVKKEKRPTKTLVVQVCLLFLPVILCIAAYTLALDLTPLAWIAFGVFVLSAAIDVTALIVHCRQKEQVPAQEVEQDQET